jgi:hypothetical protein
MNSPIETGPNLLPDQGNAFLYIQVSNELAQILINLRRSNSSEPGNGREAHPNRPTVPPYFWYPEPIPDRAYVLRPETEVKFFIPTYFISMINWSVSWILQDN